ncbi:MAG: T9SS type A sorting domain-containing protein [Candidatus Marinimicrobia bacterium]|nr:T9SS type A sorting domain-containing protein [FCB group bacterium]MBL7025592.1 T9SS type A sorting domain-containing protein [Candidatus Neomarinimicrobiota bacterium]
MQFLLKRLALFSVFSMTVFAQDFALSNTNGLTLNSNVGGWSGDYFSELYIPPADGQANSIEFNMSDLPEVEGGSMSVAIYAANYPWDEIDEELIADEAPGSWLGYYEDNGIYDIAGNNWVFGGINDLDDADTSYQYDPLGEQLWPETGMVQIPVYPNVDDEAMVTLDLENSEFGPFNFERDEAFIVVVKLGGFEVQSDGPEYRVGFLSAHSTHDPPPCLKFYNTISAPNGRTGINDWGWHIRSYVWDWSVYVGFVCTPYLFIQLEALPTTLSTENRLVSVEISDQNPSGTDDFLDSVSLVYKVNDTPAEPIEMSGSNNEYTASIPGQNPESTIEYWVEVIDIEGGQHTSNVESYYIFAPVEATLLVYDTDDNMGEEWRYMEGLDSSFSQHYDLWEATLGPVSSELVINYSTIYHVMGSGPFNDATGYAHVYRGWLASGTVDNQHCLMFSGQDYGVISGFADSSMSSSTFEGRYLGVETLGPQDINYDGTPESYLGPYAVDAVAGDQLTGQLASFAGNNLQLFYEPHRELGFDNWIDNLTPYPTATVCLTDPNQNNAAVAVYNSGPGWKTSFWALDPLGLNYYNPADTVSSYTSAVDAVGNPVANIFEWFRGAITITSLDEPEIPTMAKLHAAYPNPFNPVTSIGYELNGATDVNITVYNMLGQEVATLVAGFQIAGAYTVQWGGVDHAGHSVSSGLYFYTMRTEGFCATKKMMLLK